MRVRSARNSSRASRCGVDGADRGIGEEPRDQRLHGDAFHHVRVDHHALGVIGAQREQARAHDFR